MKFPCTLKNALLIIRVCFGMSFASKGLGYLAALLLLLSLLARYKISCYQTTLLVTILALADITLLKNTCHFLLQDEISCSGGELWRPDNYATVNLRWWCHVTSVSVDNLALVQNRIKIQIQNMANNKSFQKIKLKCSGCFK